MQEYRRDVELSTGQQVPSIWRVPPRYVTGERLAVILAPGAGSDMESPFMRHIDGALTHAGYMTVRFDFPYRAAGRRVPDRHEVLESAWRAITGAVRGDRALAPRVLVVGGRSMGGRIASQVVAAGEPCDGLLLFAYPLHPPNKPQRLRTAHFPHLGCTTLFVQGDRDALCTLDLLHGALLSIPGETRLTVIAGADHSYRVLKRSGRSNEEALAEVTTRTRDWLAELTKPETRLSGEEPD